MRKMMAEKKKKDSKKTTKSKTKATKTQSSKQKDVKSKDDSLMSKVTNVELSKKKRLLPHNLIVELDNLKSSIALLESELKSIKESLQSK